MTHAIEGLGPYVVDPVAHLGIARSAARRFRCGNLEHDDLVQEALMVLCVAARSYDATKGKFSTWAYTLIECHLIEVTADFYRMGRFGSREQNRAIACRLRKAVRRGEATDAASARRCLIDGWGSWSGQTTTEDHGRRALEFVESGEWRLDAEVHGGEAPSERVSLLDITPDTEHAEDTERAAVMAAWGRVLDALPANDREREVLDRRLLADDPATLKEIGDGWGVTRERVRQIEAGVLRRLHAAAVAAGLREAA